MLVNCNLEIDIAIPGSSGGTIQYVDQTTDARPASPAELAGDTVHFGGYAVTVVEWDGNLK